MGGVLHCPARAARLLGATDAGSPPIVGTRCTLGGIPPGRIVGGAGLVVDASIAGCPTIISSPLLFIPVVW